MKKYLKTYIIMLTLITTFTVVSIYGIYQYDPYDTILYILSAIVCAIMIAVATIYYITLKNKNRE